MIQSIHPLTRPFILIVLLLALSLPSHADISIALYTIDGVYEPSGGGDYDKILTKMRAHGLTFKSSYMPVLNARHAFKDAKTDCLSPVDQAVDLFPFPVVQTDTINHAKAYVFWRKRERATPKLEDIEGLVVGSQRGMNYGETFENLNVTYRKAQQLGSVYRALIKRYVDVMVAYTPDIWQLYNSKKIPKISYNIEQPFLVHRDSIVCHKTAETERFVKEFNSHLKTLKEQGVLQEILGLSYTPNP